jgi:hypothetical protein
MHAAELPRVSPETPDMPGRFTPWWSMPAFNSPDLHAHRVLRLPDVSSYVFLGFGVDSSWRVSSWRRFVAWRTAQTLREVASP